MKDIARFFYSFQLHLHVILKNYLVTILNIFYPRSCVEYGVSATRIADGLIRPTRALLPVSMYLDSTNARNPFCLLFNKANILDYALVTRASLVIGFTAKETYLNS